MIFGIGTDICDVRRIRVPHWKSVDGALRKKLIAAALKNDREACDAAVAD